MVGNNEQVYIISAVGEDRAIVRKRVLARRKIIPDGEPGDVQK